MKLWMSGAFQLGAMLLALSQWPALADAGQVDGAAQAQQAAVVKAPEHLSWMLEQHWRAVNGYLR